MFQSTGLFKDVSCPYFIFGLCERPYCHFKHSRHDEAKAKAALQQASTENATSEADKYTVPANSLERTLKDIEENIRDEKNKLKGITGACSSSGVSNKPTIRTKPTGTPEYNPTPINELKKQKDTGILGRSKYDLALLEKPASEQEYDPCSNFTASFKGTATSADVPEYAPNILGTKRSASNEGESESPVAKIPKFVSVEYTPAVAEASFSDEDPPGDKENWFSEDESAKDNTSDIGDNNSDIQDNVVDSASDHGDKKTDGATEDQDEDNAGDALPLEFNSDGSIKVSDVKTTKLERKPKVKHDKTEIKKEKEDNKSEDESVKKDEKKNIFSLFMAAAESVLSKASAEDKLELKSAIEEIKSSKNSERRDSTEKKDKTEAEVSSTSSSIKTADKTKSSSESHSKSKKSQDSRSSIKHEKVKCTDKLGKSDSYKRSDSKDKENRKSDSVKKTNEKTKHEHSSSAKHSNHKSKDVNDNSSHKHQSESTEKKSEKTHKHVHLKGDTTSHINNKHKHTKDSPGHSSNKLKDSDTISSSHKHDRSDKHSVKSDKSDSKKPHNDVRNSEHVGVSKSHKDSKGSKHSGHSKSHSNVKSSKSEHSKEKKLSDTSDKTKTAKKDSFKSNKISNDKPTLTPKRRRSSEKVRRLVKSRKIVDLNVDLFGAESENEDNDKEDSAKTDSAKGNKKSVIDTGIDHYDSDIDLEELEFEQAEPDVEEEFSDLEKYFSEEDPFDECLKIFNEEGPSTSAGPDKKKLKKKESQSVPEVSSGKKRIGKMPNDPTAKKPTLENKPKPKPSPAQVMMNRYKMIQQRALEAEEKEKEKIKEKVRKISAQNALNQNSATPTKNTIADASANFSNYLANKNKGPQKKTAAITATKGQKRKAHCPTVPIEKLRRPVIEVSTSSKVPTNVRQRYLNLMIDECLKLYKKEDEAYQRATEEEESVFKSISNKNIYLNKAVNTIKRLRTEVENKASGSKTKGSPLKVSHTGMLDGAHASKTSYTLHRSGGAVKIREEDFTGLELYKRLEPYILTEDQLKENNFPRSDPITGGMAVFYGENFHAQKGRTKGYEKLCVRCGKIFEVYPNGKYPKKEECVYHWGKAFKKKIAGSLETRYTCCSGDLGSDGCQVSKAHVHETNKKENLSGFMKTIARSPPPSGNHGVFALDCEMVYTTQGIELARVTVVGADQEPVYESLVKPDRPVVDYNTRFSGITEEDLEDVTTTIREVQAVLLSLFTAQTILIGHSLESDLSALKLIHSTVVDTSIVFPHRLGLPYKRALKNLMAEYLKKIIQDDVAGHDSNEDAISCLQLMQLRLKEDARKEGRR